MNKKTTVSSKSNSGKKLNITVLYSIGSEYEENKEQLIAENDTVSAATAIAKVLIKAGHNVDLLKITPDTIDKVKSINSDLIFNLVEWSGKDYRLGVKVLKTIAKQGIPFTGADAKSYDWGSDKVEMKAMFDKYQIPTPRWHAVHKKFYPRDHSIIAKLNFPMIIKPAYEHCAIGINDQSVIESIEEIQPKVTAFLKMYKEPIIAEEYIDGREFTITVVQNGKITVLPPAEIIFENSNRRRKIISFDEKWETNEAPRMWTETVIADVSDPLTPRLAQIAQIAFEKMGCKGYARLDVRIRGEEILVLEINVNPSLYDDSDDSEYGLLVSAKAAGMTFNSLVKDIAASALTGH